DDVRVNIDAQTPAHSKHVEAGVLQPGVIEVDAKVTVVFVIIASILCGGRWPEGRKAQHQDTENCQAFHDLALLPSLLSSSNTYQSNHEAPRGTNSFARWICQLRCCSGRRGGLL